MKRISPYVSYLLCAAMFVIGCFAINDNFKAMSNDVEADLASGRTLLLSGDLPADTLEQMLLSAGYIDDPADAQLISRWVIECSLNESGNQLENLGTLNSQAFKMPAEKALKEGGQSLRTRVENDYLMLGMDADWQKARSTQLSSDFGTGPTLIKAQVVNAKSIPNAPLSGITVRLREHYIDSIAPARNQGKVAEKQAVRTTRTLGYAVTDASGQARFHVEPGKSYSVVPIAPGYQYGREKGTTATGTLDSDGLNLTFRQQTHVLTPFDSYTYQALKSDRALIVRTPAQFRDGMATGAAIYLVGWLAFFLFLIMRDARLGTRTDYMLASIIMVLTGIGVLAMYGMTNPVNDKTYGLVMSQGLIIGLVAMALFSCVNPAKFFAGKSRLQAGVVPFDPIDRMLAPIRKKRSLSRTSAFSFSSGFSYLLLAVGLILMLGIFGSGPEGSDARVNLFGFQPSEVCKYFILVFVAAFFAENAMLLQAFSTKLTTLAAVRKFGTIGIVVAVMIGLMMLYLMVLSDMGPALVVLVRFILLYSMARRDFAQLLLGLLSFIGLMLAARAFNNTPATLLTAALLWFAGWIAYGWFTKRQIYESAIIVNLLIIVFALGGPILQLIGAESEAARLTNRTEMAWGGQWDNHVLGGDQVAQGIWSAASGGATGMGLGNGSPSLVPAFHTDMAITSIGEMLGLTGLVLVILCFVLLIHRSLLIGRRAGQPFTMYLVMGIALITGVQFLFIVFGSLGIMPLTGVTVPFLSYSRTSLVATMAVFGIVLAASRTRATESQLKYAGSFSGAIAASVLLFIIGALVIIGTLANYQIVNKDATLIRPAYITNTMGARVIEYNPRIGQVLDRLDAGNIYDTNGVLLATSTPDSILSASSIKNLAALGIDVVSLKKEAHRRKDRYYTMGNQMLFMLGDAGSKKVLGYSDYDPIGFMAEARYAGELRGIDIPTKAIELTSSNYRANRFMPGVDTTWKPRERNYANILPFLNDGLYDNPKIKEFNSRREERDMYLTVDARLQKSLQDAMARHFPSPEFRNLDRLRASVVVLNAATGDLLTSANYPVPDQDSIVMLDNMKLWGDAPFERIKGHKPITERDLGLTFQTPPGSTAKVMTALAGLKSLGTAAASKTYNVKLEEEIERSSRLTGTMDMEKAIVLSSNNYFIHLLHDQNLYGSLGQIYEAVGARLVDNKGVSVPTYFFNMDELNNSIPFTTLLSDIGSQGLNTYRRAINPNKRVKDIRLLWAHNEMALAWGQGALRATPLMMARVASIVANDGKLVPTRYVKRLGNRTTPTSAPVTIVGSAEASILKKYMQEESQKWSVLPNHPGDSRSIGGKTGTPERADRRGNAHCNDAWYICFMYSEKLGAPIAVALRVERTVDATSTLAAHTMGTCIIPALNSAGYQIH